jgi:hypothetical protein
LTEGNLATADLASVADGAMGADAQMVEDTNRGVPTYSSLFAEFDRASFDAYGRRNPCPCPDVDGPRGDPDARGGPEIVVTAQPNDSAISDTKLIGLDLHTRSEPDPGPDVFPPSSNEWLGH